MNSESHLYNYPLNDPTSGFKAIEGAIALSSEIDTKYFIDFRLNPKTASFPPKMLFKFFLVSSDFAT